MNCTIYVVTVVWEPRYPEDGNEWITYSLWLDEREAVATVYNTISLDRWTTASYCVVTP